MCRVCNFILNLFINFLNQINDNSFKLRAFDYSDVSSLTLHANNAKIANNLMDRFPYPYNKEDASAFIAAVMKENPVQVFAIEIGGNAVGAIGLLLQDDIYCKNAELGYWLGEPFWNKGIMQKAIPQIVEYGFQTFSIERIFARPFGRNKASQKVLIKTGFLFEYELQKVLFKKGQYEDEICFGIRK